MKVGVSIIFYDDLNSLKRCIPTLQADTIYAIDGRFKDFNSPNPLSIDGSREFLKSINNVKLIDAPDLSEAEKRNIPLKACKEDFLYHHDKCLDHNLFQKKLLIYHDQVQKKNSSLEDQAIHP